MRNREIHLMNSDHNIILACGFSGEGFKHSIVVGELVKDIILGQESWSMTSTMKKLWSPRCNKDQVLGMPFGIRMHTFVSI